MHKINWGKAQVLTGGSKLWQLGADMLSVVPGKGACWHHFCCSGACASVRAAAKAMLSAVFSFLLFLKAKILFRFLSVSSNKYYRRSIIKVNWNNEKLLKVGLPIYHKWKDIWGQWTVSATLYSSPHTSHLFQLMLYLTSFFSSKDGQGVRGGWRM